MHARSDRDRDVVDRADAEPGHDEVVEHVHARAYFRHALERRREGRGGRRSHADHRARVPEGAKRLGARDHRLALALSHGGDRIDRRVQLYDSPACVMTPGATVPAPRPLRAATGSPARHRHGGHRCRSRSSPGCARPPSRSHPPAPARPRRCPRWRYTRAAPRELRDARHFVRHHSHRVEDVAEAVVEEIFGLAYGGNRNRPGGRIERALRHLDALRGLHVRAQHDAMRGARAGASFRNCARASPCRGAAPVCRGRAASRQL